jgi:glycosyltransferase involved in cell wall biosynthesis
VIVATRNRAAHLAHVLPRLGEQVTEGAFAYEVLVIDNGSSDDTRRVIERSCLAFPVPLRYVCERRVGKSHALNTGMAHAGGRILAFTDDDARPTPGWLHALWACFIAEQPEAVAGRVVPHWAAPAPPWLTDHVFWRIGAQGCVDHGPRRLHSARLEDCRWVGSNLAIRRDAAERLGRFDVRLRRGQDTEYYRRAVDAGLAVVYEPAALIYHVIPPERLTKAYYRRWYHRAGTYQAHLMPWRRQHLLTIVPVEHYQKMWGLWQQWRTLRRRRKPWWRQFKHELLLRREVGVWWGRLQLWPRWWLTVLTGRSFLS